MAEARTEARIGGDGAASRVGIDGMAGFDSTSYSTEGGKSADGRGYSQNVLATDGGANLALLTGRCKSWLGRRRRRRKMIRDAREDGRRRAEMASAVRQ